MISNLSSFILFKINKKIAIIIFGFQFTFNNLNFAQSIHDIEKHNTTGKSKGSEHSSQVNSGNNGSTSDSSDGGGGGVDIGSGMAGLASGGASVAAGAIVLDGALAGGLTSSGKSLTSNPYTKAAGIVLIGMGIVQGIQGFINSGSETSANNSKQDLTSVGGNTSVADGGTKGDNSQIDEDDESGTQLKSSSTLTNSGFTNKQLELKQLVTNGIDELTKHGVIFDKDKLKFTMPNGDSFTAKDLSSRDKNRFPTGLQESYVKALERADTLVSNISDGVGGKLSESDEASKSSSLADALKKMKGGGGDGLSGGNGSAGLVGSFDPLNPEGQGGENQAIGGGIGGYGNSKIDPKKLVNGRFPASEKIAGLTKDYNGEPIGVAEDSIFSMVTRRYEIKNKENTFINDLLSTSLKISK